VIRVEGFTEELGGEEETFLVHSLLFSTGVGMKSEECKEGSQ